METNRQGKKTGMDVRKMSGHDLKKIGNLIGITNSKSMSTIILDKASKESRIRLGA